MTAVAHGAARLLSSEYTLLNILQAGNAVTGNATFRLGPVERHAAELLDLACRGANQTRLRRRTHQALRQLPPGQALPLLAAVLELFIAQARQLSYPDLRW